MSLKVNNQLNIGRYGYATCGAILLGVPPLLLALRDNKYMAHRIIISGTSTAALFTLITQYLPPIKENPLTIFFIGNFLFWKWKIIEISFFGDKYFESQNISKNWQVMLHSNTSSTVTFPKIDKNENEKNEKNKKISTRKQAFYQLSEFGIYAFIMYAVNKILSNPRIDIDSVPFLVKCSIMGVAMISFVTTQTCLLPSMIGLILGNTIHIKYSYQTPILSTNFLAFWKRWSVQIGDSLKNLIYKPLNGGTMGIVALFTINMLDHYVLSYMMQQQTAYIKGWSSVFATLGIGTLIDIRLAKYQRRKKTKYVVPLIRYGVLITSLITTLAVGYDTAFEVRIFDQYKK